MHIRDSFFYNTSASTLVFFLIVGMVICLISGIYVGKKTFKKGGPKQNTQDATILASVFGLFAFLLAFTFSMSGNRFEQNRLNAVHEANAIGTALLRADLYPAEERNAFRQDFKNYTQARIDYYYGGADHSLVDSAEKRANIYAELIWKRAADNARNSSSLFPALLMIPALNDMFDSASVSDISEKFRVPEPIVFMVFILCLVCTFFVGYYASYGGKNDTLIVIGFCLLSALVIYITLDLDRPRSGIIQHSTSKETILELRKQFEKQ
jgi:hypothetical protein